MKSLCGWVQEAPVYFQECKEMPDYDEIQLKLEFFSRHFLNAFVSTGRVMV